MSFSSDLRNETVTRLQHSEVPLDQMRAIAVHAAGKPVAEGYILETRHAGYYRWLSSALAEEGWHLEVKNGLFRILVEQHYPLGDALSLLRGEGEELTDAFALLFAATGSMAEPAKAAHLEYRLKNQILAAAFMQAAGRLGLTLRTLPEANVVRIYCKESQAIGDLLVRSGAMNAFIRFSQLKVDKEVLNNVNRQVNCDRANARRVAESSADQVEAIRRLDLATGLGALPATLESAARARLEHPDLSLTELGAAMTPPIGKSGMNHRLKKILSLAAELID